jgi:hypothetical protein
MLLGSAAGAQWRGVGADPARSAPYASADYGEIAVPVEALGIDIHENDA